MANTKTKDLVDLWLRKPLAEKLETKNMIKFFRRIRYTLMEQNKTGKPALPAGRYFKYAIGEIVLVVIGILIALQINNWNENQKDLKQEQVLISNLNNEFKQNYKTLEKQSSDYKEVRKSTNILISLVGLPDEELNKYNLDSIISVAIDFYDYSPTENVITELLASGKFNLIRSDALKMALFEWTSGIKEKEEAWETLDQFTQNMLLPYLTKRASLKNIDSYGFLKWEKKSRLKSNTNSLFQELEFENNLDNHAWGVAFYQITLDSLETTAQKIIRLTDD